MKTPVLFAVVALTAAGCSLKSRPVEKAHSVSDALCGAPKRVIVAEQDAGSELTRLATDALAVGLAGLGFEVLAPRRPMPPPRARPVNDWIFSSEIIEAAGRRVVVNVELYSMLKKRRVWAIADALADLRPAEPAEAVTQGVETALQMLETDLLRCRAAETNP